MLIQRGQIIAGTDAVVVRDLMRRIRATAMSPARIADQIGISIEDASAMLAGLQADGYIESEPRGWLAEGDEDDAQCWAPTIQGNALAKARIGKPMARAKAEALLEAFLGRVREANADPDELYWVDVVELFGSLANPAARTVGDVDLHVLSSARYGPEQENHCEAAIEEAERNGKVFRDWLTRAHWPQQQFERRLRRRDPLLDVQFETDGRVRDLPDGARVVEVYRRTDSK